MRISGPDDGPPGVGFRRDRLTWVAYLMLAWFAYLQAAPGLVVGHLRQELGLSYSVSGMHVAAFAAGSMVAGVLSARAETVLGRRGLIWSAAAIMGAGTIALAAGRVAAVTIGSVLVMGIGGGLLLAMIQATLADHHGPRRAVALTESNVAASVAYLALVGGLSLASALGPGWRVALLASLAVPLLAWAGNRRLAIDAPHHADPVSGRLPSAFWVAAVMLFCTTAAEWCVTGWGATYVQVNADVSADTAVTLMGGYFGGVVFGRVFGSRLARRQDPVRLLAAALVIAGAGFVVLWPSTSPLSAVVGLALLGVGLGNLYPMAMTVTVSVAPERAALASGRAVAMTSFAVLLAPLTIGTLADATTLKSAFAVVPVLLVLAAGGLALVRRSRREEAVAAAAQGTERRHSAD